MTPIEELEKWRALAKASDPIWVLSPAHGDRFKVTLCWTLADRAHTVDRYAPTVDLAVRAVLEAYRKAVPG